MSGTSFSLAKKLTETLSEALTNLELIKTDDINQEQWKMLQIEEEEVNALEQELEQLEHVRKEEARKTRREKRAEQARVLAESGHEDDALVSNEAMEEFKEAKSQLDVDLWNFENDKFQFEVLEAQLGGKDSVSVEDKSYMIAARDLDIRFAPSGDEHRRCEWISVPETRFAPITF